MQTFLYEGQILYGHWRCADIVTGDRIATIDYNFDSAKKQHDEPEKKTGFLSRANRNIDKALGFDEA